MPKRQLEARRGHEMNQEVTQINSDIELLAAMKDLMNEKAATESTLSETTEKLNASIILAQDRSKDVTRPIMTTTEKGSSLRDVQNGVQGLQDKLREAERAQKEATKNLEIAQNTVSRRDNRILKLEASLNAHIRKAAEMSKERKTAIDIANKKAEKSSNDIRELQRRLQDATNMCKKRDDTLKTAHKEAKTAANTILELQQQLESAEKLTSQQQESESNFEELYYAEKLKSIRARRSTAKYKADADRLPAATARIEELIERNNGYVAAQKTLRETFKRQDEQLAYFDLGG
ncbi:uncharacterized protein J4E92_010528 [Alternaria infectoria]|uniref:uncharacterized protein n=1 Tax=Alternaria infectoria TaxID=45303 RepID=UPI002220CAE4|nr:uncharacterized protein J4E92_010528 [Alternaria infectoria]KAI4909912.1 hypothetical protein J4E92_010528 [Alternaria infectoria]